MKAADARLIINQRSAVWLVVGAAERRRRGTSAIRCDLRGREEAKGRRRPVASATETRFTGVDGEGRRTRGGEHGWGKTRGDAGTCVDAGGGGGGRKEGVSSPTKEGRVRGQIPPAGSSHLVALPRSLTPSSASHGCSFYGSCWRRCSPSASCRPRFSHKGF